MSVRLFVLGDFVSSSSSTAASAVEPSIVTKASDQEATVVAAATTTTTTTTTNAAGSSGATKVQSSLRVLEEQCAALAGASESRPWCAMATEWIQHGVVQAQDAAELFTVDVSPTETICVAGRSRVTMRADANIGALLGQHGKLFRQRHVVHVSGRAFDVASAGSVLRVCVGSASVPLGTSKSVALLQLSSARADDVAAIDSVAAMVIPSDVQVLWACTVPQSIDSDRGKELWCEAIVSVCRLLLAR
jgi:hypothetical protein